ncbi:MAG: hypothetical protein P1S60_15380 [Anaerolineae bacterium]|nr:hypothetical protein [Anaerolineae bacterium]
MRFCWRTQSSIKIPLKYRSGDLDRLELRKELPLFLASRLHDTNPDLRQAVHTIAERLGRNLAFILLTLHRG